MTIFLLLTLTFLFVLSDLILNLFLPFNSVVLSRLLAMNYTHLLFVLLQLLCFTEIQTSAKPYEIKVQKKESRPPRGSQTISRNDNGTKDYPRRAFLFKRQKWPQLSLENSLRRVRKITKRPTATTHCKIFCRSGYHLQILPSGAVKGTVNQDSKYGKLPWQLLRFQRLQVSIHHTEKDGDWYIYPPIILSARKS